MLRTLLVGPMLGVFLVTSFLLANPAPVVADDDDQFSELRDLVKKLKSEFYYSSYGKDKFISVRLYRKNMTDAQAKQVIDLMNKTNQIIEFSLETEKEISPELLKAVPTIKNMRSLYINCPTLTDEDVKVLAGLTQLKSLTVSSEETTPNVFKSLTGLTGLTEMRVDHNKGKYNYNLHDACLRHMTKFTNLKHLNIGGRGMTDLGMGYVAKLQGLESLGISDASISREGFRHLAKLPKLKTLTISNCPTVAFDGLEGLTQLSALEELTIYTRQPLTAEAGPPLSKLKTLKTLELPKVHPDVLVGLKNHPSITRLELSNGELTDEAVKHITGLKKLEYLRLGNNKITDVGALALSDLPALETLEISSNQLTDKALAHFGTFKTLKRLDLSKNKITGAGLASLANLENLNSLSLNGNDQVKTDDLSVLFALKNLRSADFSGTQVTDDALLALKQKMPRAYITDYAGQSVSLEAMKDPFEDLKVEDISKLPVEVKVTHNDLIVKYDAPEKERKAVVEKYKDKIVEITGLVSRFDMNYGRGYGLSLQRSKRDYNSVSCYFGKRKPWMQYTPGQTLTIKGKATENYGRLFLNHCEVTKATEDPGLKTTSTALAAEYSKDADLAAEKFQENWVTTTGKIVKRSFDENGNAIIFLEGDGKLQVRFRFDEFKNIVKRKLTPGKVVTIKAAPPYLNRRDEDKNIIQFNECFPMLDEKSKG